MTTIAILAVAAPSALLCAAALALLARRLLGRLAALERRLLAADERMPTLVATLGDELAALAATNERQVRELGRLAREVERLAADVVQREVYRGGAPRHAGAIDAVRGGQDIDALMREHGLSLDEAELLVSLHGGAASRVDAAERG